MSRDRCDPAVDAWLREFWDWVAVALFLLLSVDLLTTASAAGQFGVGAEANPVMRHLLGGGFPVLVAAHLLALVTLSALFWATAETVRIAPPRYRRPLAVLVEGWLGLLVAAGLFVLANNLAALVLGATLLG